MPGGDQLATDVDIVEYGEAHTRRITGARSVRPLIEDDFDAADWRDAEGKWRVGRRLREYIRLAEPNPLPLRILRRRRVRPG